MFPIINIGPFAIQAAGLILLISLFIGTWLTGKFALSLGTNAEVIENSILIALVTGLLSARIGFMLQNPAVFMNNPLSLLSLTPSMLDASFGILVGILIAFIIAQKKHLPLWPTLDTLTPLFLLMFAGYHLANYANGAAYGLPTSLPWGVSLWNAIRHPVQLYALLPTTALFAWLLVQTRAFKFTGFMRSGVLFGVVVAGLALTTLFTRAFIAEKILLGAIDLIQILSFLILLGGLGLIHNRLYPKWRKVSAIISMGSNLDPQKKLNQAIKNLQQEFRIRRSSSRYLTEDVKGDQKTGDFLNQIIEIETDLSYPDLVKHLKTIEQAHGRESGNKTLVALDLDVLTYGGEVFTFADKHIPAPDLLKYRYVTLPLAEMAPDFRHPANGLSIQEILEKITDDSRVNQTNEVKNGITG